MVMKTTSSNQSETLIRAFCQVFSCSKAMEVFLPDQFVATQMENIKLIDPLLYS